MPRGWRDHFECFKDSLHNGPSSSSARLGIRYEFLIRRSAAQAEQNEFRSATLEKESPVSGNGVTVVSGGWSATRTWAPNGLGDHPPLSLVQVNWTVDVPSRAYPRLVADTVWSGFSKADSAKLASQST